MARRSSINKDAIEKELQELAGSARVFVKLDPKAGSAVHLTESDSPGSELQYTVTINPSRIRTGRQLERHLEFLRAQMRLP